MPDDDAKRKEDAMPRTPAANEIEEDPSLRLLDEIYDGAADAAMAEHGPIDDRGRRLAAMAQRMAGNLDSGVSDGRPIAPVDDPGATDTARIVVMQRGPLKMLVVRLYALRGEPPMPALDALTDDELRAMVRRLRPVDRQAQSDPGAPGRR